MGRSGVGGQRFFFHGERGLFSLMFFYTAALLSFFSSFFFFEIGRASNVALELRGKSSVGSSRSPPVSSGTNDREN